MSAKYIVHCTHAEKFIEPFIEFIEDNFDSNRHLFIVRENDKFKIAKRPNVILINKAVGKLHQIKTYAQLLNKADKIILHGLFDRGIFLLLFFQPWLLKKCYWVMWGGDLYWYQNRPRTFRSNQFEKIRAFVIKRIGHFVTLIKGEYELAQKWYGVRGQWHECFTYPSNLYREHAVPVKKGSSRSILLGNSATPSNDHFEVLNKLVPYKDQDILICCPLSYGDAKYAEAVIKQGQELFGDKFIPLLDFMPFEKYLELLGQIDIGIFAHKRQQAMGNTITLLGLGKEVYMRSDVTQWSFLRGIGVMVFDVEKIDLSLLDEATKLNNIKQIKEYFSEKKLHSQLEELFS